MSIYVPSIPPPAPQHALLSPSLHARGIRGFAFHGRIDEWHAPGVIVRNGVTRAAIDAAWLVARVLGAPFESPHMWPGVPRARELAIELGKSKGLYGYQREGAAFLAERDYALLIDEMGIGKTVQALIAAEARLSLGMVPSPTHPVVLILCPALAKRHWQREVEKWTGSTAVVLDGLRPDVEELSARYVICNYDILYGQQKRDASGVKHDVAHLPGWSNTLAGRFLIAILDEAHAFRTIDSRRSKSAKSMLARTPVVWALTGTPIPNYVRDIYALVELISGGLWGPSYWTWAKTYAGAVQGPYGMIDKGSSNVEALQGRLSFFSLGRSAKNVALELPEKRREIYRIDVRITAATPREGHEAMSKTAFVAKALRATAAAKRPAVVEQTCEALANKQKVIVFVYMREQAEEIGKAVKAKFDGPVTCVHGQLTPEGRDKAATAFREFEGPAAFIATIDSVNVAISLVGADLVLYGDLVPEPWKLLQSEKRAHRHGSTKRVLVRYLIATGTLDEAVADAVVEKLATIEEAMGAESEQQELSGMFSSGGRSDVEIIDGLFARLQGSGANDG